MEIIDWLKLLGMAEGGSRSNLRREHSLLRLKFILYLREVSDDASVEPERKDAK